MLKIYLFVQKSFKSTLFSRRTRSWLSLRHVRAGWVQSKCTPVLISGLLDTIPVSGKEYGGSTGGGICGEAGGWAVGRSAGCEVGSVRSVLEWEALLGDKCGWAVVNPADPGFWFCPSSVEAQRDGLSGLRPFLLFLWLHTRDSGWCLLVQNARNLVSCTSVRGSVFSFKGRTEPLCFSCLQFSWETRPTHRKT